MKKILFTIFIAAASMTANAEVVNFDGQTLNLVGAANVLGNDIQLVSRLADGGAAWYTSKLSTSDSFNINFTFSLRRNGSAPMADGIAFALQNGGSDVLGTKGFGIGYDGLDAVGSIIKSHINNQAGLNTDGNSRNTKAAGFNMGYAGLVTGFETVQYDASTQMLSMNGIFDVDGVNHSVSDSKSVDLRSKFGDSMTMGFTGATGGAQSDEQIMSFNVVSVPEPETYALMLAGLGVLGFASRRRNRQVVSVTV